MCCCCCCINDDVNDPAALSQSVSLSYLSSAYLIQCISSLLRAVLTFRQAGPLQRELLAHTRLDNLVSSLLPSFKLSVSPVSLLPSCLFISVCMCQLTFSLPLSVLHLRCICISISYPDHPCVFCSVAGALVFLNFSHSVVSQVLTLNIRWCRGEDSALSQ